MNREDTIEELCKLIEKVAEDIYDNSIEGGCICGPRHRQLEFSDLYYLTDGEAEIVEDVVDDTIVEFIKDAVNQKIASCTAKAKAKESTKAERNPDEALVLIVGNPVDGFQHLGPFYDHEEAIDWARNNANGRHWTIAPLHDLTE